MAPYQLSHLGNPQPPVPKSSCGNQLRDQPSASSTMTVRTSSPWCPCPSLPEASAENKPPGCIAAGQALATLLQEYALWWPASQYNSNQMLRLFFLCNPKPMCWIAKWSWPQVKEEGSPAVSPSCLPLPSSRFPSCLQQAGLGKPLLGDSLPTRQKCFLGYTQLGRGKRSRSSDPS